mmetsp:Transcript_29767/g.81603  ORF Transcript_29767/g.81603 Transcript_29767/m.81603 type:complete len:123 (-) Transcript_29767:222-590(-)|eukprot:CAMPEP_0117531658 /NCGR_PEP_ID=MMETSP0784-20121206/38971_1 /TAXON_ID=39447 /ORGANISM="" /LENGTH=122 /DNA_ID=CAMNT_0005328037 /DNA_START=130 /DNA_END=498 /DNA_ORIENTATION=-
MVTVLDEVVDEHYEPNKDEVEEYAVWLGMDLPEDNELIWIAREGLMAPLPKPWKPCQTENSEIFYFNFETGESTWDHPCDARYRRLYEEKKHEKKERKEKKMQREKAEKLRNQRRPIIELPN